MSGVAKLFNGHIFNKSDEEVDLNDEKYKGKVIGLYFSGHWCPPCRQFTPILIEFYENYAQEKNFEIIFMSSDNDQASFNEYYKDMPWLKLDYKERAKKEELAAKFKARGIPTLVLFDGDSGNIICADARVEIQLQDMEGEHFPWYSTEKKRSSCCVLM